VVNQQGFVPILRWEMSPWDEYDLDWTQKWDLYLGDHLISSRVAEWDTDEYLDKVIGALAGLIKRESWVPDG